MTKIASRFSGALLLRGMRNPDSRVFHDDPNVTRNAPTLDRADIRFQRIGDFLKEHTLLDMPVFAAAAFHPSTAPPGLVIS